MTQEKLHSDALSDSITGIIGKLVSSRDSDEGIVITLPSLYPSGTPVMTRVSFDGHTCFVSDMGNALNESELMGASPIVFKNQARDVASSYGVRFDNHCFFALNVDISRVVGAIQVIGNASQKSVVLTESKMAERNDTQLRREFTDKLLSMYGHDRIETDVRFTGSSTHEWTFAGSIQTDRGLVLYDTATPHFSSVSSAHTRFADIRAVPMAPKGLVGVPSLTEMRLDYVNLLQQAANVIEIDALGSPENLERLLAS
ncbi:MAG: hypothetical protein AAGF30_11240 [Pseudomonadota bacterium]